VYDLLGTSWSDFGRGPRDRRLIELVRSMDDRAVGEARALYAISANVAERVRRHNGVTAAVLYPPPRLFDRIEAGAHGDYVLTAGRLEELKRVETLIESLAMTSTPVKGKIAGDGPHRDRLADLVRRHQLEGRVELLGRVSDERLIGLYRDALAVYYAPYDEDLGLVTIEAFKAGKPVLTTADAGAVLELVHHDETGRVHPPGDAAAIAASLDLLWQDRERAATLGRRGRESVADLSWDRVIAALIGATPVAASSVSPR
jgi:glycosyltransferase involved in cell wall biosynthesis